MSLYIRGFNDIVGIDIAYDSKENLVALALREEDKDKYLIDVNYKGVSFAKINIDVKEDKDNYDLAIDVNVPSFSANYNIDLSMKKVSKITVKTGNKIESISINDIPEEDRDKIKNSLMDNPGFEEIYTNINAIMGV